MSAFNDNNNSNITDSEAENSSSTETEEVIPRMSRGFRESRMYRFSSKYDLSQLKQYEIEQTQHNDGFAALRQSVYVGQGKQLSDYWITIGTEVAKLATDADENEKYKEASELYSTAIEYLQQALSILSNGSNPDHGEQKNKTETVDKKISEYKSRKEHIIMFQDQIAKQEIPNSPTSPGSSQQNPRRMTLLWNNFFDVNFISFRNFL